MGEPPTPDGEILELARAVLGDQPPATASYPDLVRRLCDELRRSRSEVAGAVGPPSAATARPPDPRVPPAPAARRPGGRSERQVLDALTEAFAILEPVRDEAGEVVDFRVAYANRVAADCARMRHTDALGRRVTEVVSGAGPAGLLDLYRRVFRTGRPAVIDDFTMAEPGGDPDDPSRLALRVSRIDSGLAVAWRDVTEVHRSRRARDEAEGRLCMVIDAIPSLVTYIDRAGRYRMNNRAYETWFARDRSEFTGRHVAEALGEDLWSRLRPHFEAALRGSPVTFEVDYPSPDGRPRHTRVTYVPEVGPGGEVVGVVALITDITEYRRALEAARESQDLFRAFMDHSSAVAWMKDERGRYVYLSRPFEVRFGARLADWRGRTDRDFFPEAVAAALAVHDRKVLATGRTLQSVERIVEPDGAVSHWMVAKFLHVDRAGQRHVGGIAIDITEGQRAEEALRLKEERLRLAVEATGLGTWEVDPATGELTGSDRSREILDLPAKGPVWAADLLTRVHPDDRPRVEIAFRNALHPPPDSPAVDLREECRIVDRGGQLRWIMARGRRFGSPPRFLGTVRDVTEQHRLDEQRVELMRRLVAAQEEERQRIARELHDQMGQYLSALGLAVKSVRDEQGSAEGARGPLGRLQELTEEMGRVVHRLAWELRPSALDDVGLVGALGHYAAEWSERSGVELDTQIDDRLGRLAPEVETTVYRVVQEALTNIARHAGSARASLVLERRNGGLLLVVEDDGRGFDPEATGPPSLGLLGIAERVALVHGSFLVESTPGGGTSLFVRIPMTGESRGAADG